MKKNFCLLLILLMTSCSTANWRTANRESAGIAPRAEELQESIFQIYTARAFAWRGYFAVHPWVAWKKKEDSQYTVAQVSSWALRRGDSAITVERDLPDRYWFGHAPQIIFTAHGAAAERIIQRIQPLIEEYPYKATYRLWPGPNSNTFVDYLIRHTPEITVELPPHAIGKDYLVDSRFFARSPSGKGGQFSLWGALGLTVGLHEGVELNILGLTFDFDVLRPALKIPFFGRVGLVDEPKDLKD